MDLPMDNTLQKLIERSRSLLRFADALKQKHNAVLNQLDDLRERLPTDPFPENGS